MAWFFSPAFELRSRSKILSPEKENGACNRADAPCTRCAMHGTEVEDMNTSTPLYDGVHKELLRSADLEREPRQARKHVVRLFGERFLVGDTEPLHLRCHAWWFGCCPGPRCVSMISVGSYKSLVTMKAFGFETLSYRSPAHGKEKDRAKRLRHGLGMLAGALCLATCWMGREFGKSPSLH